MMGRCRRVFGENYIWLVSIWLDLRFSFFVLIFPRNRPFGQGGFRGRGGFGPSGVNGPPMRGGGRGSQQPPFFPRGGSGGGSSGASNYDQQPNWNGAPQTTTTTGHVNPFAPVSTHKPNAPSSGSHLAANAGQQQQPELWVETKTAEGKSYYYHALSRETTWIRPEGARVKIMSQTDVEALTAKNQQQQQQNQQQQQQKADENPTGDEPMAVDNGSDSAKDANGGDKIPSDAGSKDSNKGSLAESLPDKTLNKSDSAPSQEQQVSAVVAHLKPLLQQTIHNQPPPQQQPQQQQQHHHQQHHHHQQLPPHFSGPPPHFGGPQYGMPPPGYGGYPQANAWGMPWQQPPQMAVEQPAKNLIVKPGVIEPQIISRAAEWSEHRAPDGRPYYYHAARGESVWEKPQAIRDLEGIIHIGNHNLNVVYSQEPSTFNQIIESLLSTYYYSTLYK